jgi:hypothetical protein
MVDLGYPTCDADDRLYETEGGSTRHPDKAIARESVAWVEVKGRKKLAVCGKPTDCIPDPTLRAGG